jgi:transcriptional regulator with XRE-family HTH domain
MSSSAQINFMKSSSPSRSDARTFQAEMALKNQAIAQRIRGLREARGNPPQPIVAAKVGVSLRTYQNWEAGDAKPEYRNLERLSDYFGVSEEFILTGAENSVPESPVVMTRTVEDVRAEFQRHVQLMRADLEKVLRNQVLLMRALGVREEASTGEPLVPYPEAEAPQREDRRRANGGDRRGQGTR